MKRRQALLTLPATAAASCGKSQAAEEAGFDYENPYESVDWDSWELVHSMSHQHQGTTQKSLELFHEMGYGHFAFSNYYPSAPTALLPSFRDNHPEIVWAPNAEQHSFLDSGLHFNSLGSSLATGYGKYLSAAQRNKSPLVCQFEKLSPFDKQSPWAGVYRLDLRLQAGAEANDTETVATLSIGGATACDRNDSFADKGPVDGREFPAGNHTVYLRADSDTIDLTLDYDPKNLSVSRCRLMQGTNRPWRDMFRVALDGEQRDGEVNGGLLYPDGGGITLNHPGGKLDTYIEMLDFDPQRVLGIEVWNQLTSGFGSDRGFYQSMVEPPAHFYNLWDEILATGRRCWGFFVKDHNTYGRGRNILLTPSLAGASPEDREASLLKAYRHGSFFGSVASIAIDENGQVTAPFDQSDFRFRYLRLRRDLNNRPVAVEAAVSGNDIEKRPNVQIRFITEQGVAKVVDAGEGNFELPRESEKAPRFVRVEAIAWPDTHLNGKPLDSKLIRSLNPAQIAGLHDRQIKRGPTFYGNPAELRSPIPIVDQIFSQPIRKTNL